MSQGCVTTFILNCHYMQMFVTVHIKRKWDQHLNKIFMIFYLISDLLIFKLINCFCDLDKFFTWRPLSFKFVFYKIRLYLHYCQYYYMCFNISRYVVHYLVH